MKNTPNPKGVNWERELKHYLEACDYVVTRACGSFGVDLVAIKNGIAYLIECKNTKDGAIYLSRSRRTKEQARALEDKAARCNAVAVFAVRFSGEPRVYLAPFPPIMKPNDGKDIRFFADGARVDHSG